MPAEPTHAGARFQFDRLEVQGDQARYRVTVSWPRSESTSNTSQIAATLRPDGFELGEPSHTLAPWMHDSVTAFVRVLVKNYDAEAGWPRLVHRWRPAK